MNQLLLLAGVVIVACILMNRIAAKLPLPSLLLFIGLGMCFGVDGFFKIPFDDYELSEAICSVSLLFVMFYGGFGTNDDECGVDYFVDVSQMVLGELSILVHLLDEKDKVISEKDLKINII